MDSDTIFCILEHLSCLGDILSCTRINKQFNIISKNELIWKRLCEIYYPGKINNSYYENFKSWCGLNRFLEKYGQFGVTTKLELGWKLLESLPPEIGLLTGLRDLQLIFNNFESLPSSISLLTNLETLNVGWCGLKSLPEELCLLTKLRHLKINNNYGINTLLPLSGLTNLKTLEIDRYQMPNVPHELRNIIVL
jgi:Leucine-rich repeat (LRR) protein